MGELLVGKQLLCNPDIKPTNGLIAEGLGEAYLAYAKFIKELEEHFAISLMDWRFYNDGKAWLSKGEYKWITLRGANKVKPIFWLSIWEGFFKVSFFFSASLQNELMNLSIGQKTKDIIKQAKAMGKTMRFIPVVLDVTNEKQLGDVYAIAEHRKLKVK